MAQCRHLIEQQDCTDCTPRAIDPQAAAAGEGYGPWITAAYDSSCPGCGDDIMPGDRIRADGSGGWLCEPCGQNSLDEVLDDIAWQADPGQNARQAGFGPVPDRIKASYTVADFMTGGG